MNRTAYAEWIAANVEGDGYGKCAEVTLAMAQAFPELARRRGIFHDVRWGERTHWWLRTPSGEIVDPTARQHIGAVSFPQGWMVELYEDLTDLTDDELADRVPSGRCMDCGEPVFRGATFCSDTCARRTEAYLNGGPL